MMANDKLKRNCCDLYLDLLLIFMRIPIITHFTLNLNSHPSCLRPSEEGNLNTLIHLHMQEYLHALKGYFKKNARRPHVL